MRPLKSKHYINWLGLQLLVLLCWPKESQAYVDPGTGGAILTALMAGVSGFAVVLQILRKKLFGDKSALEDNPSGGDNIAETGESAKPAKTDSSTDNS